MDKITHQVRAEHWAKIMNECINSGMSKTAWCRANGISEKQFFYWQRILRREAFENSQNSSLPATVGSDQELTPATQRTVSFTEVKLPSSSQSTAPVFHPDLVIRKGSLILEISSSASISLPDIQIYAAGLMVWHLLLNSTSSWIHMKRTSFFSSVADEVTASRGLYGKATDSFSFTKGWSLAASAGPVQKKRHWKSHQNNTRL